MNISMSEDNFMDEYRLINPLMRKPELIYIMYYDICSFLSLKVNKYNNYDKKMIVLSFYCKKLYIMGCCDYSWKSIFRGIFPSVCLFTPCVFLATSLFTKLHETVHGVLHLTFIPTIVVYYPISLHLNHILSFPSFALFHLTERCNALTRSLSNSRYRYSIYSYHPHFELCNFFSYLFIH